MRLMQIKKPEPGSARDLASKRMKAKWADPEYRKSVEERQKAKWADPAYRAMILASKGNPIPISLRPALAEHYKDRISILKNQIYKLQKRVSVLEYQCSLVEQGEDPTHANLIVFGDRNKGSKLAPENATVRKENKALFAGIHRTRDVKPRKPPVSER